MSDVWDEIESYKECKRLEWSEIAKLLSVGLSTLYRHKKNRSDPRGMYAIALRQLTSCVAEEHAEYHAEQSLSIADWLLEFEDTPTTAKHYRELAESLRDRINALEKESDQLRAVNANLQGQLNKPISLSQGRKMSNTRTTSPSKPPMPGR